MFNKLKKSICILALSGVIAILLPLNVWAAMSSTNYTIYADSIGMDGGSLSTSTSYSLQDTAGESPAGAATSTSYTLTGGYQAMERGAFSMDISGSSLNLGTLSATAVNTASVVITISSDSTTGYTLSISDVSGTSPAAITLGGAVTAGTEGYGFAASGADSLIVGDAPVANGSIASSNAPVSGSATTLTFKASMSATSGAGSFGQTITFTATANF